MAMAACSMVCSPMFFSLSSIDVVGEAVLAAASMPGGMAIRERRHDADEISSFGSADSSGLGLRFVLCDHCAEPR